ncbi:MAG: serine/threonine-protein kinase [Nocardioides sp.]
MPTPPQNIAGRYRVLEEAGRGGMGSVWRCVDDRLGREVAVKQVGLMPGESVTDRARALREARSTAALNHPNVVSVYDAVAEDDHVWLVMEHVHGRTLAQILREEGALTPARVTWIGAQVADGLAAAHARGTVHRDVKPGNVLVTDEDRAKISDFGIARTVGDATLTHSGIFTGTPNYIAPEVARGGSPGPASDVWALGASLFAAVEGRPPYDSDSNALAVLATISTEEPRAPERAGPLTEPIQRMLDRDPDSRWTMGEVAHALHMLHDPPAAPTETRAETKVRAVPVPVPEPVPVPVPATVPVAEQPRRRRRGPALVAALVTLLVVAIAGLALRDSGDSPTADPEPSGGSSASKETAEDTPTDPGTPEASAAEPEPEATEEPEPEATEEPEPEASEGPEPSQPAPASGGSRFAFVEDYYADLPGDPESGYQRLAASYQGETSYESYEGFWSGIDEVVVQDTAPAGAGAVDVTLLYNGDDAEVRRIYLERGDEGWLIVADEIVG